MSYKKYNKTYKGLLPPGASRTNYRVECNLHNVMIWKGDPDLEEACKNHKLYPFKILELGPMILEGYHKIRIDTGIYLIWEPKERHLI